MTKRLFGDEAALLAKGARNRSAWVRDPLPNAQKSATLVIRPEDAANMLKGLAATKRLKHGGVPTALVLFLPWVPTINHYYGPKAGGGKYIKPEGKQFRWDTECAFAVAKRIKATGRLSVRIVANPPDRRRRDLDNLLKCLLDALQHAGCYDDDEQIDRLTIERREVVDGGRLTVFIEALPT